MPRPATLCLLALLAGATIGCRQDMHDQPRYEPYEESAFFADGMASREPIPGTVARGQLRENTVFHTGLDVEGRPVTELPVALTHELLRRGQERYDIFCSPCHDHTGSGRGMVVQRGFKQPTSLHDVRLKAAPVGYFFDVMSNGFGSMSSYSAQLPPEDRWAVAAYLRALQWSQGARLTELPESDRRHLAEIPTDDPR